MLVCYRPRNPGRISLRRKMCECVCVCVCACFLCCCSQSHRTTSLHTCEYPFSSKSSSPAPSAGARVTATWCYLGSRDEARNRSFHFSDLIGTHVKVMPKKDGKCLRCNKLSTVSVAESRGFPMPPPRTRLCRLCQVTNARDVGNESKLIHWGPWLFQTSGPESGASVSVELDV